ncbi:MAG: hypothetical protein Q8910_11065 [Bacteroidota bacterium]|nr:hypothetical protein [Bacteroidota bacterium]MDP4226908.1 hypothetical protein [Bacteroidota bacterium]
MNLFQSIRHTKVFRLVLVKYIKKLRLFTGMVVLAVSLSQPIFAQIDYYSGQYKKVYAQVRDQDDNSPVSLARIVIIKSKMGTLSDSLGFFSLFVHRSDTLSISSIGYFTRKIPASVFWGNYTSSPFILLQKRVYSIEKVTIYSLGSYQQFRQKVIDLKLPETPKFNPKAAVVERKDLITLKPQASIPIGSPITMLYNLFSKEGKSMRKLAELQQEENLQKQLEKKYNASIVRDITGLKGKEVYDFMKFCGIPNIFVLQGTDYEIYERINICYKEYLKKKK